ncbi:hypothetical protein BT67DRAFT_362379, partial [Trichocladium antarcticum]
RVDPNRQDNYGIAPLLIAAKNEYLGVVETLLATGLVELEPQDPFGLTPIWWARRNGH